MTNRKSNSKHQTCAGALAAQCRKWAREAEEQKTRNAEKPKTKEPKPS
jgi:hypothetical protein